MGNQLPALIFGALLIVTGGAALLHQLRAGQQHVDDFKLDPADRRHLYLRNRRRTQVAGLILLIGVMIPVGDSLIPFQKAPTTFAIYWIIVLGLAFWIILLGLVDMLSTRVHSQVSLDRLRAQQRDLEEAANALRRRKEQEQVARKLPD